MCALFDTLIGDADGIYDPGTYNDRLLLGLKGTMSEAELHILKARMHEGRCAKARRGELFLGLPRGYVLKPSGEVALDPDEGVQRAIRLVFAVFERRRSVSGVLRYLVDQTCNCLIACGAGRTREMSAGIVPIARRYRTCCAIRPMLAPTPSGVATMMAVAGFRVSRIVVDLIYVIRINGWYSTKMRCRRI